MRRKNTVEVRGSFHKNTINKKENTIMNDHRESSAMEVFCGVLFVASLAVAFGIAWAVN